MGWLDVFCFLPAENGNNIRKTKKLNRVRVENIGQKKNKLEKAVIAVYLKCDKYAYGNKDH